MFKIKTIFFTRPVKKLKVTKCKVKKLYSIQTSNFGKCASGAVPALAEIGHLWHFQTVPLSLTFYFHHFVIFNDQNWTRNVNIEYQCGFF